MKKIIVVILLLVLALPVLAEPIGQEEAIKIAVEAIAFKWVEEQNLLDENKWEQMIFYQHMKESPQAGYQQWEICFMPKDVRLSEYVLQIREDGQVLDAWKNPGTDDPAITPSQVQDAYTLIHGHMKDWEADTWIAFQRDLKRAAEACGTDVLPGNLGLFLIQQYAKPGEGIITREEALAIASRLPEAPEQSDLKKSGAVLLMDGEVPVWKVQLIPLFSDGRKGPFLAEIHARTGEVREFRQVAADDDRYRLYYVLDRLIPPSQDAAVPPLSRVTPRPDGKPYFWYSPKAPDYYWEAMDRLWEQNDPGQLMRRWEAEYGKNAIFWPLDAQAFYHTVDNMDALTGTFPGLPDEEDISRERALEIARQAVMDNGMNQEELNRLTPAFRFNFNETVPSGHEWMVDFFLVEGVDTRYITGVSIDAKSGRVIGVGGNG